MTTAAAWFCVTHDNRILDVADRIFHMEEGRIRESLATMEKIS